LRDGQLQASGSLNELRRMANLPLRISASGYWKNGFWETLLQRENVNDYRVNGKRLEINSTVDQKIRIMRLLLEQEEVKDVNIQTPSLEELYVHYTATEGSKHA
jgi:Cu-processing system ATP-binding protein